METPQTTFCQRAGSSSWRAPSVQRAAIVVDMVSAVVENAAIKVMMITGIRIAPNGTCFKNSQMPDTAPPSLICLLYTSYFGNVYGELDALGIQPGTLEAARFAIGRCFYNWTFVPYSFYGITGLLIAWLFFNKKERCV